MIQIDGVFHDTIETVDWASAASVRLYNLPLLAQLPGLPPATSVALDGLPLLAQLPELPSAASVELRNLPLIPAAVLERARK